VTEFHFSWGAHLLLWVFPLSLALMAIVLYLLEIRRGGERR